MQATDQGLSVSSHNEELNEFLHSLMSVVADEKERQIADKAENLISISLTSNGKTYMPCRSHI
jgi:hypothetical protein